MSNFFVDFSYFEDPKHFGLCVGLDRGLEKVKPKIWRNPNKGLYQSFDVCIFSLFIYSRRYTAQQQQQQRGSRGFPGQPGTRGFRTGAPNWSFVFDPAGRLCYYWSMVVSLAFLYNFWVIIYRFAFQEING